MKKRLLALLTSLGLVFSMMAVVPEGAVLSICGVIPANAEASIVDSGTCGNNLTWTLDDDGTLTISGSGKMENYKWNYLPPYIDNNIKRVVISNNVTSIGDYAFYCCTSLTSITIPNSVTSIGDFAFYICKSLTNITIPNSVTSIGRSSTFSCCTSLTNITIPNGVTSIGYMTFESCESLSSVVIPQSVTFIDESAFFDCKALVSINIPNSVTCISDRVFYGCTSLTNITIPNSVTCIGSDVFSGCRSLESLNIPNSVTCIGSGVFSNCTSLTNITIPNSVTCISDSAFSGCTSLTNITIPNSVTCIGHFAFRGCTSLGTIDLPNSVKTIDVFAFNNCINLTSITIPNSVTCIGSGAFSSCESLTNITILNSVTSIDSGAFSGGSLTIECISGSTAENYAKEYYIKYKLIPHTHSYTSQVTRSSNCLSEGVRTYTCSCGNSYTESIPKLTTHTFDNWKVSKAATCTAEGIEIRICSICGKSETRAIAIDKTNHSYTSKVTKAATCASTGTMTYTCDCGDSYTMPIPMTNHEYVSMIISPTSTQRGYTLHTCSICGDSFKDSFTNIIHTHSYTSRVTKSATCAATGTMTYTCDCGDSYTVPIPMINHEYVSMIISPTSTQRGYTLHTCSICGDSYKDNYKPKLDAPKFTTQPQNATVGKAGDIAAFTVKASGTDITYAWFYRDSTSDWKKTSVTTNKYSVVVTEARNGRQMYCEVTDKYGVTVKSNVVTMRIGETANITSQPKSVTVGKAGDVASFTIAAEGTGLKYAWFYRDGTSAWKKTSVTTNKYSVVVTEARHGRQMYCKITNKFGNTVDSDIVTMRIGETANITSQPKNATVGKAGDIAAFTVSATGTGLKYAWFYRDGTSAWKKTSVTTNKYSIVVTEARNGRQMYCEVTNKYGNITKSNVVTMKIGK